MTRRGRSEVAGEPLAPLALRYGDSTPGQRCWINDKVDEQLAWWRETLASDPG